MRLICDPQKIDAAIPGVERAVVNRLLEGVDVLIHMAGTSVECPLPEIIENNLRGLVEVYEGAQRHGVKRIRRRIPFFPH